MRGLVIFRSCPLWVRRMATYNSYIALLCEEIKTVWRGPQSLVYAKQIYKRSNPKSGLLRCV